MGAKSADGPPAYDSVIQPHLNTREQNSATNGVEGATSITDNTNGISTITIESDVPSNAANNASNTQATGESANVAAPPTTTIIDIAANEKSKDSIV